MRTGPWMKVALCFAVASIAQSCASAPERIDPALEPDDVLADSVLSAGGVLPGLAAAVIRDGELVYEAVSGERRAGSSDPVRETDAFHIGSDTKAMTALLCGVLVDRGLLGWDSTVGEAFGAMCGLRDEYRDVTLAMLLSHTAGLPSGLPGPVWMSFFPYDSPAGADRARMAAESLALKPASAPGSGFLYSNLGYVVAGRMLELASGTSWEALMRDELFGPLGLDGAGFGPPAKGGDGPWGHAPDPVDPASIYADNPAALGPAGTVHASLGDLQKYVRLYLDGGRTPAGRTVVSEASLAEILRPRAGAYALGWAVVEDAAGRRVIAHDGSNTMFYCSIAIWPDDGDAVIVLANRGDGGAEAKVGELVSYLAERFLGQAEPVE